MTRHPQAIAMAGILLAAPAPFAQEADAGSEDAGRRQFEEIVVTAERRESTVQDTAIAITAFTGEFIEDFGLRNQEDLQNYLPATTIQPYDLSIRGVGRLFRALGGDPGRRHLLRRRVLRGLRHRLDGGRPVRHRTHRVPPRSRRAPCTAAMAWAGP